MVQTLLPELDHHYSGDELKFSKLTHLKHVVQTGFTALRGVNYFKDFMVYAVPSIQAHSIPTNSEDDDAHHFHENGRAQAYTNGELAKVAEIFWDCYLSQHAASGQPILMSCSVDNPLGFASLLACAAHQKKLFIPGTLNVSKMLKSLPAQKSTLAICDSSLYNVDLPPKVAAQYKESCESVTHVLTVGEQPRNSSDLFAHASHDHIDFGLSKLR